MSKMKSLLYLRFFSSLFLLLVPGLADESSSSTNEKKAVNNKSMGSPVVLEIVILCIGVAISVWVFKLWQRKKREEQQARLLKLFEEDDQLEQELGI